jgi:hypothetical protein
MEVFIIIKLSINILYIYNIAILLFSRCWLKGPLPMLLFCDMLTIVIRDVSKGRSRGLWTCVLVYFIIGNLGYGKHILNLVLTCFKILLSNVFFNQWWKAMFLFNQWYNDFKAKSILRQFGVDKTTFKGTEVKVHLGPLAQGQRCHSPFAPKLSSNMIG